MRESAVYAISQLPPSILLQKLLLKCLHDPYLDIRLRAIEILKNYKHPDVMLQMKRLANDLDIEICEASVDTIKALEDPEHKNLIVDEIEQAQAPFEHIQSIQEDQKSHTIESFDDFDSDKDEFFDTQEDSIHIENDFIHIENNELDEFIIPPKPNHQDQIEKAASSFETSVEEENQEDEKVVKKEANINQTIESPEVLKPTSVKEAAIQSDEFDLFSMDEASIAKQSQTDPVDLFAMDEEQTPASATIDDFDVFADIEPSDNFTSPTPVDSVIKVEKQSVSTPDDFDLFDFDGPDTKKTPTSNSKTEVLITQDDFTTLDEFPDFNVEEETKQPQEEIPQIPSETNIDDFPDFESIPEEIVEEESHPNPLGNSETIEIEDPIPPNISSLTVEENNVALPDQTSLQDTEPEADDEFLDFPIQEQLAQTSPQDTTTRVDPATQNSLNFLYEIHDRFLAQKQEFEIDEKLYFEPINLNNKISLFEDYPIKTLSPSHQEWLPKVQIPLSVQQMPVRAIPVKRPELKDAIVQKTSPVLLKTAIREKPNTKALINPINKEQISLQITAVLKEIGNQSYQLCQEYDPENEEIAKVYTTILKIQSHLDAMIKGKLKATAKLNLKIIKRKLDLTFEKLGRLTLKEINGKRFVLHNSENYQKKIRFLVKKLNS